MKDQFEVNEQVRLHDNLYKYNVVVRRKKPKGTQIFKPKNIKGALTIKEKVARNKEDITDYLVIGTEKTANEERMIEFIALEEDIRPLH